MKRKVLAISLLLGLIFCQWVFSQDYNVLIYPQNAQISTYISTFFTSKLVTPSIYTDFSNRALTEDLKTSGEALVKAYSTENEASILKAKEEYSKAFLEDVSLDFGSSDELEVALTSFNDTSIDIDKVISNKDLLTLDYISSNSSASLVLIPMIGELGGFKHLALYSYETSNKSLTLVYEELSQSSSEFSLQVLLKLSALFSDTPASVLTFDGLPQGVSVYIDGTLVTLVDSSVVLSAGTHTIDIELTGYQAKHLKTELKSNTISTIFVQMDKDVYDSLLIESKPSATISSDGNVLGVTPYTLTDYTLPLMLNFNSEGYVNKTISLDEERKSISVELKPSWMNDEESYDKARTNFYNSFARSLLIFGLKIVSKSFSSNYNEFWMATDTICTGALFLSLTDLAVNLIDYYKYSEYISP